MSENPYLSPTAETDAPDMADAPQSHGWMVKDHTLYVEPNAQLPTVDPFTGETEDWMILHAMRMRRHPIWLILLAWTAAGFVLIAFMTPLLGIVGPLRLAIASGLAMGIGAKISSSFTLNALFTQQSSAEIVLLSRIRICLGIALAGLFLTLWVVLLRGSMEARILVGILLGVVIVVWIGLPFFFKRLTCRRGMGPHLEIRGVHPEAIERLRELSQG